ncbi:hypothetical protein AQ768_01750 [Burkholderia pseudomallei]|nr:hypothetical protein AQ768_01750 [Burkholderia pseudomallei]
MANERERITRQRAARVQVVLDAFAYAGDVGVQACVVEVLVRAAAIGELFTLCGEPIDGVELAFDGGKLRAF